MLKENHNKKIDMGYLHNTYSIGPIYYLNDVWRKIVWPSIHEDVFPVYEGNCLPHKIVAAGLRNSHRDIHNWKTDRPGHRVEVVTAVAVSQLEVIVRVDQ